MYIVTTVKLYDNNTIDVAVAESSEKARALRQESIDNLLLLYSEVDFNVLGNEFSEYVTVNQDNDSKKSWMVVKITKHAG